MLVGPMRVGEGWGYVLHRQVSNLQPTCALYVIMSTLIKNTIVNIKSSHYKLPNASLDKIGLLLRGPMGGWVTFSARYNHVFNLQPIYYKITFPNLMQ